MIDFVQFIQEHEEEILGKKSKNKPDRAIAAHIVSKSRQLDKEIK
ncbi:MAG: hypothetical protein ACLTDX_18115 [[Clostridium] innocuum]